MGYTLLGRPGPLFSPIIVRCPPSSKAVVLDYFLLISSILKSRTVSSVATTPTPAQTLCTLNGGLNP